MNGSRLLVVLIPASAKLGGNQDRLWTGTWAAAPLRTEADGHLSGATLRQIIHTSVGGDELRIQVSNVFGDQPLEIADAHVALWRRGASIIADTDHRVSFGGQSSIVIPPGNAVHSDPVAFKTPALADLAVSFYLPSQSGSLVACPSDNVSTCFTSKVYGPIWQLADSFRRRT